MVETDLAEVLTIEEENLSPWSVESLAEELAVQQALQYVAEVPGGHLIGWCVGRVLHA